MVDEALRRFTVMQSAAGADTAAPPEDPATRALVAVFQHLAKLDGWAKIAIDRLAVDPENARAAADLKLGMEHAARLHPQFMRTLSEVCATTAPSGGTAPFPVRPVPGQA